MATDIAWGSDGWHVATFLFSGTGFVSGACHYDHPGGGYGSFPRDSGHAAAGSRCFEENVIHARRYTDFTRYLGAETLLSSLWQDLLIGFPRLVR